MIEYNINKNKIEGYSYSEIGKVQETKSRIRGTIKGKKINIEEFEIIHSSDSNQLFCLLNIVGKLDKKQKANAISGTFKGYINNSKNKPCGIGSFTLLEQATILKNQQVIDNLITHIDTQTTDRQSSLLVEKSKITLSKNVIEKYYTNDYKIEFIIKDLNVIDGDIISIYNNDVLILDQYKIDHNNKSIILPLNDSINKIKIIAHNEGYQSPNTAGIILIDKNRSQIFQLNLNQFEQCHIEIIKL